MKAVRHVLLGLSVLAIALGFGLVAGFAAIFATNAFLPPFRPEDDETLRELLPAALAYATMAGTAGLVVVLAGRRLRSRSGDSSRDLRRR